MSIQSIYNKLKIKTELKEKKIKLSLVGDIDNLVQKGENLRTDFDNKLESYYDRIISAKNDFSVITNMYDALEENNNELRNLLERLENNLADFGLENDIEEVIYAKAYINRHDDVIAEWFEANRVNEKIEV